MGRHSALLSLGVNLGLVRPWLRAGYGASGRPRRKAAYADMEGSRSPLPALADHLGLEGEQRRRFLDLQRQLFEETVRVRMRQAESQREVRRELVSREPDQERIGALLQQSARDFLTLEQALAKNIVATRAILSPGQEREYLRIIARMRPPGAGGFGQQQQPQRRRLPPMRERGFPRGRRGSFPSDSGIAPSDSGIARATQGSPERLRDRPERLRDRPERLRDRPRATQGSPRATQDRPESLRFLSPPYRLETPSPSRR